MEINGKTCGIIYMAFGDRSAHAVRLSYSSIIRHNEDIKAITVGDHTVTPLEHIYWNGKTPWATTGHIRQRFRAGEVKPFLYDLSPFDYTLYLDADTECLGSLRPGFEFLINYDIGATYPGHLKKHAHQPKEHWTTFNQENDFTWKYLEGKKDKYVCSGAIFFRKSPQAKLFFASWYKEWLRFGNWDEQFAFIRTEHDHPEVKILHMEDKWDTNVKLPDTVIYHAWGKRAARDLEDG